MSNDLDKYIQKISIYPRITKSKEKMLSKIILEGSKKQKQTALDEMICGNLFLVVKVASKMYKKFEGTTNLTIMDMINEGNVALVNAARLYNYKHSSKSSFCSYLYKSIELTILENIKRNTSMIRIPSNHFKYWNVISKMISKGSSLKEISKSIKLPINHIQNILKGKQKEILSLDELIDNNSSTNLIDTIEDNHDQNTLEEIKNKSLNAYIKEKTKCLNQLECIVLEKVHFGDKKITFRDIGQEIGLSHERARQIYQKALSKLKKNIIYDWLKLNQNNNLSKQEISKITFENLICDRFTKDILPKKRNNNKENFHETFKKRLGKNRGKSRLDQKKSKP